MQKLTAVISKSNCVAIFINQIREKIGVVYGNPETTPGGRALKFYASVRIEVRRGEAIKNGAEVIGNRTRCKVVKNKVAPPFKEAEFDIMYGKGISRVGEILDIAAELDIIHKAGAWFSYEGNKIGQGRDNTKDYLSSNPELLAEIEAKVKEQKDSLVMASRKNKKAAALGEAASAAASSGAASSGTSGQSGAPKPSVTVEPDDEDFDEFTPAEG